MLTVQNCKITLTKTEKNIEFFEKKRVKRDFLKQRLNNAKNGFKCCLFQKIRQNFKNNLLILSGRSQKDTYKKKVLETTYHIVFLKAIRKKTFFVLFIKII